MAFLCPCGQQVVPVCMTTQLLQSSGRSRFAWPQAKSQVWFCVTQACHLATPRKHVKTTLYWSGCLLGWLKARPHCVKPGWRLNLMGPVAFADDLLGPLLVAVGQGWSAQRVRVFEEHGLSAVVLRVLAASTSGPLPQVAVGTTGGAPTVLLTTLSGEQHSLGLAMVEAVLRSAGARPVSLGASLPLEDVVAASQCFRANVVALSLSPALSGRLALQQIIRLRRLLPAHVGLWVGGSGVSALARIPRGVSAFTCCRGIEAALVDHTARAPLAQRPTTVHDVVVAKTGDTPEVTDTLD